MTMGAFSVLNPRIDGLGCLELFFTLSTTVLIERHRIRSFLSVTFGNIGLIRRVIEALTSLPSVGDLNRLIDIHLF